MGVGGLGNTGPKVLLFFACLFVFPPVQRPRTELTTLKLSRGLWDRETQDVTGFLFVCLFGLYVQGPSTELSTMRLRQGLGIGK